MDELQPDSAMPASRLFVCFFVCLFLGLGEFDVDLGESGASGCGLRLWELWGSELQVALYVR